MDRKNELLKMLEGIEESKRVIISPMIDDIVFLELRLNELRKLPFIRIHPTDSSMQKPTPAAKQYKELLQQYNNCVKIALHVLGSEEGEEDSPLRAYLKRVQEV